MFLMLLEACDEALTGVCPLQHMQVSPLLCGAPCQKQTGWGHLHGGQGLGF